MADCFIGEIRLFGGSYAPEDWEFCHGQLKTIAGNEALFALLGTRHGGDGKTNFALPNLQGSVVVGCGQSPDDPTITYTMGQIGGAENVTLSTAEAPSHTHQMMATTAQATTATPGPTVGFASVSGQNLLAYTDVSMGLKPNVPPINYGSDAVSTAGGMASHPNMMPSLALNYIIALRGLFPQR